MSMIYVIQQASDATIEALLQNPSQVVSFVSGEQPSESKSPGLIARLFGARDPTLKTFEPNQFETGEDICDLDKAWHGLHFLLTGSDWSGEPPEGFILNGGTEIGTVDVGYGPARAYTTLQTNQIHRCLVQLDEQTLRSRFDSAKMMELEIYPTIWDRDPSEDDTLGYVIAAFEQLREFVAKTQQRNYGMVSHLG